MAIASALMSEPELLILDEPTSELDPQGKDELFAVIERLRQGGDHTVIVVEHEVDRLVRFADRIVVMDNGAILADGTPLEVFTGPDVNDRTAGERLPAAAELLARSTDAGFLTHSVATLDLDEALAQVILRLETTK